MPYPFQPVIDLQHAPTLWQVLHDDNPVRIVVGPLGSGKTTFCAAEVLSRAFQQEPGPDNIRRFKVAIVRNTMPQLKRTTIPTWQAVVPEESTAPIRYSTPAQQHIVIRPTDTEPGLDLLIEFIALDTPKDVAHLLSWEGTMIWFNEVREIPKAIIDMAELRVGRYPSIAKGGVEPTWYGILGDTNPPDEDHWIYMAQHGLNEYGESVGKPLGWSIYFQPPGVVEMAENDNGGWMAKPSEGIELAVDDPKYIHFAAGTYWATNPTAENLPNLPFNRVFDPDADPNDTFLRQLGPGGYYARGLQGKNLDWIRSYLQGRYQFVKEGKAVIGEFNQQIMVVDDLPIYPSEIFGGSDIGGNTLNPATVFFQRAPRGIWCVQSEVAASGMGLDRFEGEMSTEFSRTFPGRNKAEVQLYGDPAGRTRDGIFETVAFDHLISKGWAALPAPSNDINIRIDAIQAPMGRLIDGKPGILIHRRCVKLIKALAGAWHYRKLQTSGRARYAEKPEKTHPYSDLGDGLGYGLSGAGETRQVKRGAQGPVDARDNDGMPMTPPARVAPGGVFVAQTDFDPLG